MSKNIRELSIFVSSPFDTGTERKLLVSVVDELNKSICPAFDVALRVIRWEEDIPPALGRPQSIINERIGEYDVYMGFMWKRFGTPTGRAESGTEEELTDAYLRLRQSGKPKVMFYFSEIPYVVETTDEVDQLREVVEFRNILQKNGLIRRYSSIDELAKFLRHDLSIVIRESEAPNNRWRTTDADLLVIPLPKGTAKADKPSFIRHIVTLWANATNNFEIADKVLTQLLLREELGSTGLGGWAFPHIYQLPSMRNYVLLVVVEDGVNWSAQDRKRTQVVMFYLLNHHSRDACGIRLFSACANISVDYKPPGNPLEGDYLAEITKHVSSAISGLGSDLIQLKEIKKIDIASPRSTEV